MFANNASNRVVYAALVVALACACSSPLMQSSNNPADTTTSSGADEPMAGSLPSAPSETVTLPSASGGHNSKIKISDVELPLAFEPNVGQTDNKVQFLSRVPGYTVYLSSDAMTFELVTDAPSSDALLAKDPEQDSPIIESTAVRVELLGANENIKAEGYELLSSVSHYFIGSDPSKWISDISNYETVRFEEIYPGIDVHYYGTDYLGQGQILEHDFIVSPGADPSLIRFSVKGGLEVRIDEAGDLVIGLTPDHEIRFKRPYAYLDGDKDQKVDVEFDLTSDGEVGFRVASYDTAKELTIDPVTLTYSTYTGGSSGEVGFDVALDTTSSGCTGAGSECAVVVGYTKSTDFPTGSAYDGTLAGSMDAFVMRLNSGASARTYSTYIGGNNLDLANSVRLDASGNVYVTGYTTSTDFPTQSAAQGSNGGDYDAFVLKLSANGSALTYSTYLGGSAFDRSAQNEVDSAGNQYLVGATTSDGLATLGVIQSARAGNADAFIAKYDSNGSLSILTYLGGSSRDLGTSIAVDSSGNVYVAGETRSSDFPTSVGVHDASLGGSQDAFVAKLNSSLTTKTYSTYLGGSNVETQAGIGLDSISLGCTSVGAPCLAIVGTTSSSDLPTVNPNDNSLGGSKDVYVARLNSSASALTYSTYLGGSDLDEALGFRSIDVDAKGRLWITGKTASASGFPTTNAYQATYPAGATSAAFVTLLRPNNSAANQIGFSTYLGGVDADVLGSTNGSTFGVGIDANANTDSGFVVGVAGANFPIAGSVVGPANAGSKDAFALKLTQPVFADPAFRAASSNAGSSTSVALTIPSGTLVDDVMIACVSNRTNASVSVAPAGWTQIATQLNGTDGRVTVFVKVASATESNPTFTLSGSSAFAAGIVSYSNVATSRPIDLIATNTTASSNTHAAPSVTTTFASDMIATCHAENRNTNWTAPAGMTERVDSAGGTGSNGITLLMSDVLQVSLGSSGTKSATAGGMAVGEVATIALVRQ